MFYCLAQKIALLGPKGTRNCSLVIGMTSLFCNTKVVFLANAGMKEEKGPSLDCPVPRLATVVAFPASTRRGRKWRKRNLEACRKSTLSQAGSDRKSNFCSTLPFKIQQKIRILLYQISVRIYIFPKMCIEDFFLKIIFIRKKYFYWFILSLLYFVKRLSNELNQ